MVYNTRTFALAENCFNNNTIPDVDASNVPDNIDEAISTILYETEINYNRLMGVSGVFGSGFVNEEVITEAVDFKAFFKKVKEFFKNLLEKIAKLFKKIMEKAKEFFKNIFNKKSDSDSGSNSQKNNSSNKNNVSSATKMLGYANDDILALPKKEYNDITYKGYNYTHLEEGTSKLNSDNIFGAIYTYCNKIADKLDNLIIDGRGELTPEEFLTTFEKGLTEERTKFNSSTTKNDIQKGIYSAILKNDSHPDNQDAWNRELFKYFRNGQSSPIDITIGESDITEYQNIINKRGDTDIAKCTCNSFNMINQEIEYHLRDFYPAKYAKEKEDGSLKHKLAYEHFYEVHKFMTFWLKQAIVAVTEFTTSQSNAIMERARQYKRALTQMLNQ